MFGLLRFGIKAGIATSAVYLTVDNGVWKDSETTSKLYDKIISDVGFYANPYLEKVPLPDLPRTGSYVGTAQNTWNLGVKSTCKFLAVAPTCSVGYLKKGYKYIEEQTNELLVASKAIPPST